jgi:hypothetical protein
METQKTLEYEWEFGKEELAISISAYHMSDGLYIGLYSKGEEGFDFFGDLTVNLPGYLLDDYEAFITGDSSKDKLNFIKENKLGKIQPWKGKSGMGTYAVVKFDPKRLEEFDRTGLQEYQRINEIEPTKESNVEKRKEKETRR